MVEDLLQKVALHMQRAEVAKREILAWEQPLTAAFTDPQKIQTIDSFIYRFLKLQDMLGAKILPAFLDSLGEYEPSMSLLDVLDRMEKLGWIADANTWMQQRKLRNLLTHEYPDNEKEIAEGIALALEAFSDICALLECIGDNVKSC